MLHDFHYLTLMFDQSSLPLRKLDRSRSHQFQYVPDGETLKNLAAEGEWRKLKNIALRGELHPQDWGWKLEGKLEGSTVLACVISDAPVNFPLNLKFQREYYKELPETPQDFSWDADFNVDQEEMPQNLDLNALIIEVIALEVPDYPRLKKYETGEYADEHWQLNPDENAEAAEEKPFAALKEMLQQKKT